MDANNTDGHVNTNWTSDNQMFTATLLMKVTTVLIMYLTPIIIGKSSFTKIKILFNVSNPHKCVRIYGTSFEFFTISNSARSGSLLLKVPNIY